MLEERLIAPEVISLKHEVAEWVKLPLTFDFHDVWDGAAGERGS